MKLNKKIIPAKIIKNMSAGELVGSFESCAFGAGRLYEAVDIYRQMQDDPECTKFFGLAGAMVPAGMRQIVSDMIRDKQVDILVSTGANLVHDIIESLGLHHYKGTDATDDIQLKHEAIQ